MDQASYGRRPRPGVVVAAVALAVFQVVGTFGAARNQRGGHRLGAGLLGQHELDALALVIAVAGPLALPAARRRPRAVTGFVAAITALYLARDYPFGPVFASLVIATVWCIASGHRVVAWCALGATVAVHFGVALGVRGATWSWPWVLGVTAWALLVLAIGELVRVRGERMAAARQARAEAQRRQANEERLRIAHELHDVVAHHMSLINVQAAVALHVADRKPEQAQTALAAIRDASKEALTELRALVGVLRADGAAAPRTPTVGLAALDDLVERSRHAGLVVTKTVRGDSRRLPSSVEQAAVRIVQEAITNVVRHAAAQQAQIVLDFQLDAIVVSVSDDGHGFAVQPRDALGSGIVGSGIVGSGIVGMRERAEALGGWLEVGTSEAGGAHILARLPTPSERQGGVSL